MCDSRQPLNGADSQPPVAVLPPDYVDPMTVPCEYCGALAFEPCNWDCLGGLTGLHEVGE